MLTDILNIEWKDMTEADHAWEKVSGLYGDWIDSGKKVPFELYKEFRRMAFHNKYENNADNRHRS